MYSRAMTNVNNEKTKVTINQFFFLLIGAEKVHAHKMRWIKIISIFITENICTFGVVALVFFARLTGFV